MSFTQSVRQCFSKYATFTGRASRPELWYFVLFLVLSQFVAAVLDYGLGSTVFEPVVGLGTLLPSLAVEIRRLHDIGRSGWWLLLGLVPVVGGIILLVWFCRRGDPVANPYGAPV
jgi:uncharacterized membrane protein YhaH (DUF805 family)